MSAGGTVVTFELATDPTDAKRAAFAVVDALRLVDISNNLGDTKSLVTHPGTTTHRRLTPGERERQGITDGVIRLSVGLEDPEDLRADLVQALDQP
jgi:O-succinylhomoserine sulfhydrylase